ncbi:MAG: GNAT family N-acetyltransferase [Rhodospirillales bacterium]|nr:GNAT family N-acetyltransferase [Rhodospirillales bacterium]
MTPRQVRLEFRGAEAASTVAELQRRCFEEAWGRSAIADLLGMSGVFCVVAAKDAGLGVDTEPWGFIMCRIAADECEVLSFGVLPAVRRRGVARELLATALDHAAENQTNKVFLEVSDGNIAATTLYGGFGFRIVGTRRGYYGDRTELSSDAHVLALDLSDAKSS